MATILEAARPSLLRRDNREGIPIDGKVDGINATVVFE